MSHSSQESNPLVADSFETKDWVDMSNQPNEIQAAQAKSPFPIPVLDTCYNTSQRVERVKPAERESPEELEKNVEVLNKAFLVVDALEGAPEPDSTTSHDTSADPTSQAFNDLMIESFLMGSWMPTTQKTSQYDNAPPDTVMETMPPIRFPDSFEGPLRKISFDTKPRSLYSELVEAARLGNLALVQSLLRQGAPTDLCPGDMHEAPLAVASYHGHRSIVETLLEAGASLYQPPGWSPETLSFSEKTTCPALKRAFNAGHLGVVKLLRERGRIRHQMAQQQHRQDELAGGGSISDISGERSGFQARVLEALSGEAECSSNDAYRRVEHLRLNFIIRYRQMAKMAKKSVTNFGPCLRGIGGYRDAWENGVRVFRGLSRLTLPSSLEDTLSFLCMSRAVADTLGKDGDGYFDEFVHDLGSWEETFDEESDRDAYLEALKLTWDVSLDCFKQQHHSNQQQFLLVMRDNAAKFILQANGALGLDSLGFGLGRCGSQREDYLLDILAPHIGEVNSRTRYDRRFSRIVVRLVTGVIFALVVFFSEGMCPHLEHECDCAR